MKQITRIGATGMMLTALIAGSAWAEMPNLRDMSPQERRETLRTMSPEQRAEFQRARKEKWQSMSQDEKLNLIEKHRSERLQKREEKWNSMSAEEKIRHAEEKMQKRREKAKGRNAE